MNKNKPSKRGFSARVTEEMRHKLAPFRLQLFRERLSQKLCTRQSRKVIWDMINTLVLDTVAVEPTFVVSFSPRKHTSMASRAIL